VALTPKQNAFVAEYLVDRNATRAAERAGYRGKPHTLEVTGSDLLRHPEVRRCIDEALARRAARVEVKADDVLRELLRLAMVDIGEAFDDNGRLKPLNEMSADVRRAISGLDYEEATENRGAIRKVKFWDKKGALELLGKHLKLFTDKIEHSGGLTLEQLILQARQKKEPT
jgi:phage terminase small subunit